MVKKIAAVLIAGACLVAFVKLGVAQRFEDTRGKQYIGNQNTGTYHCINCESAKKISLNEKVVFNSAQEAVKSGCRPCATCNPPVKD